MKKLNKVNTWLPGFNGFYDSLWEDSEEIEISDINYVRKEKGFSPINYDDCEFDYEKFYERLSKEICFTIGEYLKTNRFIHAYKYEKLSSPREYNFSNDAIWVTMVLNKENEKNISEYLKTNKMDFMKYIKNKYTSYDGFMSSYSNDVDVWLNDDYLTHEHKLGSVLDFILDHRLENEDGEKSADIWLYEQIEYKFICPENYEELVNLIENKMEVI